MRKLSLPGLAIAAAIIGTFAMTGAIGSQPALASRPIQVADRSDHGNNARRNNGGSNRGNSDQQDNRRNNGQIYNYGYGGQYNQYNNGYSQQDDHGNDRGNNGAPYYNGNGGQYYNGNGYPGSNANANVHGIVTSISGNRVTILQGLLSSIAIDDQPAINSGRVRNLYVSRSISAYGYWGNGIFYATGIQ